MTGNKIIKLTGLFVAIFAISFLFCFRTVKAEDRIDVEYPVEHNLNGGKIFNEKNILPGWEDSKTIRVENDSETDDVNLYFTLDVNGDKLLAKALKLYVIRVENGSYRIGGEGDRYTLKKADDEELYMDKLSATKGKQYRIKIKFDKDSGNEYQGVETKFDIDFKIESRIADERTEEEILADQGRIVTGFPPVGGEQDILPEIREEAAVVGEGDQEIEIAGAKKQCNNWPWWVWALILLGYLIVFYKFTFTKKNKVNKDIPWGWQITMAVVAVIFWWYFDNCREYLWFLYGSLGGSGLEYIAFLWTRNKKRYDEAKDRIERENR